ncbi:aquaporin-like protein [Dendryphion nanum]|uniref:Aquaporin-like protein n=1 Tax=Dendryphion nanum TaxID=256645 RepID=A0A9P9IME1_9PLEO|nr:aquaporin-like protein [Dendryphion nanum]
MSGRGFTAHSILPLHRNQASVNGHSNGTSNGTSHGHNFSANDEPTLAKRWRNEFVAAAAEFAGTFMFLFFAFGGTQVANTAAIYSDRATAGQEGGSITQAPNTSVLLYIALSFGFSLMVNVWVFFRVSGGLFNPAVTLGLYLIGAISPIRAVLCFISQMLAGICSAGIVSAILPGPLSVATTLGTGTSIAQGVFLEMFLTALLVFTIFMLAAEKHKATFLAPIGIGLALFVAEMVGVFFTGGSLNPARSFGPCIITGVWPGYHYIYWVGPLMGTLLAFGMYRIVKIVEYQTVNPGQDFDDHEAALFKPPSNPSSATQVERPNVAAIAMEEAMRMASRSSGSGSEHKVDGIESRLSSDRYPTNQTSNMSPSQRLDAVQGQNTGAAYGTRQ